MKKVKLLVLLFNLFFILQVSAQFTPRIKGQKSFMRFFKSETYFVYTGNAAVDSVMVQGVQEYWDITPSHFISEEEFALVSRDSDKSFVYFKKLKQLGLQKKISTLCLVNGGYDSKARYVDNTLSYVSIDNEGYEKNLEDVIFRLKHIIYQLQDVVKINQEQNFVERNTNIVLRKYVKNYNLKSNQLKDKTILVDVRYLNIKIVSKNQFKSLYTFNVEFVSKEVIAKAIREKDSSKAYLISALNLFKINTVTDCETAQVLYAEYEERNEQTDVFNENFNKEDMILLNTQVKAKR